MNGQTMVQTQTEARYTFTPILRGALQRADACGQHNSRSGGECDECKKKRPDMLQRSAVNTSSTYEVPPIVHEVLRSPGQPLDMETRNFMEPRFGQDFSAVQAHRKEYFPVSTRLAIGAPNDVFEQEAEMMTNSLKSNTTLSQTRRYDFSGVRVHTDTRAGASAQTIGALAYTVGNDIVFDDGRFTPQTSEGRSLLAHELTHVVQQGHVIRPYRSKRAFNFGRADDMVLKEDSFNSKRDKETKPWIKLITVEFTSQKTDAYGNKYWVGTAIAEYYDNPAKLPSLSFDIAGGSEALGKTDKGNFTVQRIEGIGYNSGTFSGRPGIDYPRASREGPRNRYSKDLGGNMNYAVFYNRGEALHGGPLDYSSHGCVHVDWYKPEMRQINYHSVIGLTEVKVKYSSP